MNDLRADKIEMRGFVARLSYLASEWVFQQINVEINRDEFSKSANVIDAKWVFTRKTNGIFKAKLVVRGFKEKIFHYIDEIYAPVPKLETLRMLSDNAPP